MKSYCKRKSVSCHYFRRSCPLGKGKETLSELLEEYRREGIERGLSKFALISLERDRRKGLNGEKKKKNEKGEGRKAGRDLIGDLRLT